MLAQGEEKVSACDYRGGDSDYVSLSSPEGSCMQDLSLCSELLLLLNGRQSMCE